MKNRLKALQIQCCFTSTETIRTIRDGESRTVTSTFTQLPSSAPVEFKYCFVVSYVHRDHKDYWGRGAQDGHLDFHTAPELCMTGWKASDLNRQGSNVPPRANSYVIPISGLVLGVVKGIRHVLCGLVCSTHQRTFPVQCYFTSTEP